MFSERGVSFNLKVFGIIIYLYYLITYFNVTVEFREITLSFGDEIFFLEVLRYHSSSSKKRRIFRIQIISG